MRENKNARNKSTNAPTNTMKPPIGNTAAMNRSSNGVQKSDTPGQIKLPKVNTIANSSVSNSSMKGIW